MKLDCNILRYLSKDDWRVLTAVEMGQKNHELVPTPLIDSIAKLKHGGTLKSLSMLLRHKLVHHENVKYDAYRLTYLGYDYLALNALVKRGMLSSVGRQIGVGKESDIFEVGNDDGEVMALKLHRLGRTSFRDVKSKRDYLGRGKHYSWLYLSRLAAVKEYAFMKALGERGLPVPVAYDHNRHAVLMELVDAFPLVQVREVQDPGTVYARLMELMCQLVKLGLVHCDFNEFNILIGKDNELTVIDFPQMVSISHTNARDLFERDVQCVMRFFRKKLNFWMDDDNRPTWEEVIAEANFDDAVDKELAASGFRNEDEQALNAAIQERQRGAGVDGDKPAAGDQAGDSEEDEEEEEEGGEDRIGEYGEAEGVGSDGASSSGQDCSADEVEGASHAENRNSLSQLDGSLQRRSQHPVSSSNGDAAAASAAYKQEKQEGGDSASSSSRSHGDEENAGGLVTGTGTADEGQEVSPDDEDTAEEELARQRMVQARVQAQRKAAAARAVAQKISRNVSKAKGKNRKQNTSFWD